MACTCSEMGARFCDDCIGSGRADVSDRSVGSTAAREQFKRDMVRQLRTKGEARIPDWMFAEGWPGFIPVRAMPPSRQYYVHR